MKKWLDRDRTTDVLLSHIRNLNLSFHRVHEISGVATGTLAKWDDGTTQQPRNMTQLAVSAALGLLRADYFDKHGEVQVDYKLGLDRDWDKEIEKQANFLLKHGTEKQKKAIRAKRAKKKKPNGHAT
jgi:uncharacterized protein HemY